MSHQYDGVGVTDPVLSDGVASMVPGISERSAGATRFLHLDRLGTNARTTDASGAVVGTAGYDAFGRQTQYGNVPGSQAGFVAAAGYQEDGETGLKLLGHRYYDPGTGRFLTRDPIQDGTNWYRYCENNPLRSIDPSGLDTITDYIKNLPVQYGSDYEGLIQELKDIAEILAKESGKEAALELSKSLIARYQRRAIISQAVDVYRQVQGRGGVAPHGYKGGRIFKNYQGRLPPGRIYREYNIVPFTLGVNRGVLRIVIDDESGRVFLTTDHYDNFIDITPNKR